MCKLRDYILEIIITLFITSLQHTAISQNKVLTLQDAYKLAEKNYPLLRQKDLIKQTERLNIHNLQSSYLPQVTVNAQGSYQSDVTRFDLPLPNVKFPKINKDQYRVTGDVNQLLLDGGLIDHQKRIQRLNAEVDEAKVDVDLYQVKHKAVQVYFTILYQDELLRQSTLNLSNIQLGIDKVAAQVKNGVALKSNLQVLQAQFLQSNQRTSEIKNTRKGLIEALSLLIGQQLSEEVTLERVAEAISNDTIHQRPELLLFNKQEAQLEQQKKLIESGNQPKLSAFFQAGYGRPGLNMLSNDFEVFYITGLRVNWQLGKLYNSKRDQQLVNINKQSIAVQRETFLLNTNTQLVQQRAEIEKYKTLVDADAAIVELRQSITQSAKAQLENAVITANDYLREVNAEDAARQSLITHQLQLLQAQVNYQIISGKF